MEIKNIFAFILFLFIFNTSFCQKFWDHTFLTSGFAFSDQDRRLFEFPNQEEIIAAEDSRYDYEYNLVLQKKIVMLGKFQTSVGLGFSTYNSTFSRPYEHSAINGGNDLFLRFIRRYTIDKLIFPISNTLFLNRKQSIFLEFNIIPALAFRKSVKRISERHTKWELEVNSLELYPGLGVKLNKRMWVTAQYRWLYINKLDEVIFNQTLFYQRDPEFLRKKYDDYNPFKVWFTVSYALGE